ncbi:MAG: hypothetical protein JWP08_2236 [Bryobacterales bacterium]|nr:hypothetical protein [Bryobacterales bacterium]
MSFLRYFVYIVAGALAASVLGGVFACVVALVSPEFVSTLFGRPGPEGQRLGGLSNAGKAWKL